VPSQRDAKQLENLNAAALVSPQDIERAKAAARLYDTPAIQCHAGCQGGTL
jgi:hypothetical protein